MRRAFRQPGFTRLFAGLTTSMFGDSVMLLVLSMWVKTLTGSNGAAGLTFFWMVVPALFAPLYGMYIDRIRRKPLLVWGNVISALMVLPLLAVREAGDVWIVYAVAFLYGISFVVLPAGLNGLLKEMIPGNLLVEANSSVQTTKEGFRLIGPLVGAALFGLFGGGIVAVVDSLSFLVAALIIASIPLQENAPERSEQHWWLEMTGGVRHLVREPVLRHTLIAFGLMLIVIGFSEASIYAVLDFFGKPPTFAGVVVTVQGVGAILGGVMASRWVRRLGEAGTVTVGMGLLALGLGIVALTSTLWVTLAGVVVLGYSLPLTFIAFMTMLQRRTPQALMGRVSAAVETVMGAPQAVSLAVGALLVTLLDYHAVFAIMTAFTGTAVLYLLISLHGQLFRPDPPPAPATAKPGPAPSEVRVTSPERRGPEPGG
ncbi:MAG: MFS transporter [Actinomycetota bacterium]